MQLSQSVPPHGWRSSFAAASTTLDTRAAMVMGPTPPGTGVMADATDATFAADEVEQEIPGSPPMQLPSGFDKLNLDKLAGQVDLFSDLQILKCIAA